MQKKKKYNSKNNTSSGLEERTSGRHQEQQGHFDEWSGALGPVPVVAASVAVAAVAAAAELLLLRLGDVPVGEPVRDPDTERESPGRCCE